MAEIAPNLRQRYEDDDGNPLAGGKLYSYEAGSSTPKDTFQNRAASVLNTNPIILDANGCCDIWLGQGYYKFVLTDADDVPIFERDDIANPFVPEVPADDITNDMLADMVANRIKGRVTTDGTPVDLTPLQVNTLLSDGATDSTTTGADQTLGTVSTKTLRLTNASLTSITMINEGYPFQEFTLINKTGVEIVIKNDAGGTATKRILTGTAAGLDLSNNASLKFCYDDTSDRWVVVGGSGGGGGTIESIDDIEDVELTGLADGDVLAYDQADNNWKNSSRLTDAEQDILDIDDDLSDHLADVANPHAVTKAQVGLSNVDNTSDATKNAASVALTNKSIDADANTITNIANAQIKAAAAIAVNKLAALTASRAVASDGSGFLTPSATTATELGYLSGVTSAVQTQLDAKQAGAQLIPYRVDGVSSPEDYTENTLQYFRFGYDTSDIQYIYYRVKIPSNYVTGNRIKISGLKFKVNSTDTTKRVLINASTWLVKTGDVVSTFANSPYASTNTEVAVTATANSLIAVGDIYCNHTNFQIDSRDPAADADLIIRIKRDVAGESAAFLGSVDLLKDSANIRFTT